MKHTTQHSRYFNHVGIESESELIRVCNLNRSDFKNGAYYDELRLDTDYILPTDVYMTYLSDSITTFKKILYFYLMVFEKHALIENRFDELERVCEYDMLRVCGFLDGIHETPPKCVIAQALTSLVCELHLNTTIARFIPVLLEIERRLTKCN